jgi:hypothetical protein
MSLILIPAYGRDYKSKKEVLADFEANKDFIVMPHKQATNKSDLVRLNEKNIQFRYGKLRKVFIHTI